MKSFSAILFLALMLSGCNGTSTRNLESMAPYSNYKASSVTVIGNFEMSSAAINDKYKLYFDNYLKKNLYGTTKFKEGFDLTIKYRFLLLI